MVALGAFGFFAVASAWSVLDANFSTDTWMGLATGRQLMQQLDWSRFDDTFPRLDTFSYTFYGRLFFNQNWLGNLGQYWIYDRISPAAVVYATWLTALCIHAAVLFAVYFRTRSWLAAWLAAGVSAFGMRDFMEPRAAIVGLLCLASFWALISAVEGQRDRVRWWPIVLLLPVLVVWSNAHGSFSLGFVLLGLYVGHWIVARLCRKRRLALATLLVPLGVLAVLANSKVDLLFLDDPTFMRWLSLPLYAGYWISVRSRPVDTAASAMQIVAITGILACAVLLAAALGPFGAQNIGKTGSPTIFRSVLEWYPAYARIGDVFPPMWRFWAILAALASSMYLLWMGARFAGRWQSDVLPEATPGPWRSYDLAVVLIALCMTLWARRFAPLFYVLSAPVLATWVMQWGIALKPSLRRQAIAFLGTTATLFAILLGGITVVMAYRELIEPFRDRPEVGILERARGDGPMHEALRFLGRNAFRVNLFTDYADGGSAMFFAPRARVFIDGRAQQLYTEQHFAKYRALVSKRTPAALLIRMLHESGTEAVLVRRAEPWAGLRRALESSSDWVLVLLNSHYALYFHRASAALARARMLIDEGMEWRPSRSAIVAPDALASRALVLLNTLPPAPRQALQLLQEALNRQRALGITFHPLVVRLLMEDAGAGAAESYVAVEASRIAADATLGNEVRSALLSGLSDLRARIERER
jgi:hypothetical protein